MWKAAAMTATQKRLLATAIINLTKLEQRLSRSLEEQVYPPLSGICVDLSIVSVDLTEIMPRDVARKIVDK
jgi:hypothetical protein